MNAVKVVLDLTDGYRQNWLVYMHVRRVMSDGMNGGFFASALQFYM
jgi:hypothetical protein